VSRVRWGGARCPRPAGRFERPQPLYRGGVLVRASSPNEGLSEHALTVLCQLSYAGNRAGRGTRTRRSPSQGRRLSATPIRPRVPATRRAMERPGLEPGPPTFQVGALPVELSLQYASGGNRTHGHRLERPASLANGDSGSNGLRAIRKLCQLSWELTRASIRGTYRSRAPGRGLEPLTIGVTARYPHLGGLPGTIGPGGIRTRAMSRLKVECRNLVAASGPRGTEDLQPSLPMDTRGVEPRSAPREGRILPLDHASRWARADSNRRLPRYQRDPLTS
jgi:hypothetical protein